jgi:hypothetical protein
MLNMILFKFDDISIKIIHSQKKITAQFAHYTIFLF